MIEDNLGNTFSADAYKQMDGFVKRCRGVNIYFKIENPAGARIQEFFVEGKRLEKDKIYTVALVTEQGVPKKFGKNRRDTDVKAIKSLKAYFTKHKIIKAEMRGTVVAV